jgi:cell division protein FtsL
MADINLLPEEFRQEDNVERKKVSKKPTKVEVTLTSPEKIKDSTNKKGFWKKILNGGGKSFSLPDNGKDKGATPAERKMSHARPPTEPVVHMPEKSHKHEVKSETLEKDGNRKSVPPINPHMSEFKQEEKKVEIEKPDSPLQVPSNDKSNKKDDGKSSITFEDENIPATVKDKVIAQPGKVLSLIRTIVYKFTRKKPKKVTVNLMPESKISFKDVNWTRIVRMLVVSIGVAAAVTILWYLLLLDRERQSQQEFDSLQQDIAALRLQIAQLEDDQKDALLLKSKLDLAGKLLTEHVYWTQFLTLLEELTLDGVYFNGLNTTLDEDSSVELSGVADSLETVYWQRETFSTHKMIVKSEVVNTGQSEEGASFTLRIVVNPMVWKR